MRKDKQVPDKLVEMFPQYTRKQLYFMLYPFWTAISDRFKRKQSDVSNVSITVKGLGKFQFRSTAAMRKTAKKFERRYKRKIVKFHRKKELQKDKLIY